MATLCRILPRVYLFSACHPTIQQLLTTQYPVQYVQFLPLRVQFLFTVARLLRRPPGPEFRGIFREIGPRSPATGFQRFDPPLGGTLLHGEAGKLTRGVGFASPRDVPWRGGRRAWRAGFRRAEGGARRKKRAQSGQKAAHAGASGASGVCAGAGIRGKTGPSRAFFRGRAGKSRAAPGQNGAFGRPSGAGTAGVGGEKAPFCREKGGQRGCVGAKTGGESWRGV